MPVKAHRSPNGTAYDIWASRWCYECKIDGPFSRGEADQGCPIIMAALMKVTPAEWTEVGLQDYHCSEFIPDDHDDGDDDPEPHPLYPPPQVEGQVDMFEVFAENIAEQAVKPAVVGTAR